MIDDTLRAFLGAGLMGAVAVLAIGVAYAKDRALDKLRAELADMLERKARELSEAERAEREKCAAERLDAAEKLEQARREATSELRARVEDGNRYTNMALALQRDMLSVSDRMMAALQDRTGRGSRP